MHFHNNYCPKITQNRSKSRNFAIWGKVWLATFVENEISNILHTITHTTGIFLAIIIAFLQWLLHFHNNYCPEITQNRSKSRNFAIWGKVWLATFVANEISNIFHTIKHITGISLKWWLRFCNNYCIFTIIIAQKSLKIAPNRVISRFGAKCDWQLLLQMRFLTFSIP